MIHRSFVLLVVGSYLSLFLTASSSLLLRYYRFCSLPQLCTSCWRYLLKSSPSSLALSSCLNRKLKCNIWDTTRYIFDNWDINKQLIFKIKVLRQQIRSILRSVLQLLRIFLAKSNTIQCCLWSFVSNLYSHISYE